MSRQRNMLASWVGGSIFLLTICVLIPIVLFWHVASALAVPVPISLLV